MNTSTFYILIIAAISICFLGGIATIWLAKTQGRKNNEAINGAVSKVTLKNKVLYNPIILTYVFFVSAFALLIIYAVISGK